MIDIATIQDKVNTAKLFFQVLTDRYIAKLIKGCDEKPENYDCLNWFVSALSGDVDNDFNTDNTQTLYNQLCVLLGGYSEVYTVDPNAVVPNVTVNETGVELPEMDYTQDNLLQDDNMNWYLPLVDSNNDNILAKAVVSVLYNGDSLPGFQFSQNYLPYRIYGFFTNDTATIKVTYSM